MNFDWLVVTPPIITLVLAFFWHDVIKSLLVGIGIACLIAGHGSAESTGYAFWSSFKESILDVQSLYIAIFLLALGIVITIIDAVGGAQCFSSFLARFISNAQGSQLASMVMSFSLFIDDNLNTITTGYVIHPLTDRFKIARAKLAFLVDALAAPMTILIPLTSWIAVIIRQYEFSGISTQLEQQPIILADPYYAYLRTIPFIFYSIFLIISVLFIIVFNISFGPMAYHEKIAQETGNLFGGKDSCRAQHIGKQMCGTLLDLIAPIVTVVITVIGGIAWSGNYWLVGGHNTLITTLQTADIPIVLVWAAIAGLLVSLSIGIHRKLFTTNWQANTNIIRQGIEVMLPAVIIVNLAGMFGVLLKDHLHTGTYLAHFAMQNIGIELFPAVIFIIASAISIAIGSAWGTIAVVLPIALQMLATNTLTELPVSLEHLCIALPTLGAVLSGAVAGDHISPISGTTIMSSASAGAHHMDHVITQFWYAIPALIASCVGFIIAGKLSACYSASTTVVLALLAGTITCCGILTICHWIYHRK